MTTADVWQYTTIGEMARDSRVLGYDYAAPATPDSAGTPPGPGEAATRAAGEHLYLLFPGVRCIRETYILDVFVNLAQPKIADIDGPHYVGRMTRLGMGIADDKGRCNHRGVTRIMDATHTARALRLSSDSPVTVSHWSCMPTAESTCPPPSTTSSPASPLAPRGAARCRTKPRRVREETFMTLAAFDPPGYLDDFKQIPGQLQQWSDAVSGWFDSNIELIKKHYLAGGKPQYFNESKFEPPGPLLDQLIPWNALPGTLRNTYGRYHALQIADDLVPLTQRIDGPGSYFVGPVWRGLVLPATG